MIKSGKKGKIFYGWYIVLGAALIVAIAYSMRYSFSVFYKAIIDEFGWSRAETAAAFSVSLLVYGLSSPVVGTLADRLGPRKVCLVSGKTQKKRLYPRDNERNNFL